MFKSTCFFSARIFFSSIVATFRIPQISNRLQEWIHFYHIHVRKSLQLLCISKGYLSITKKETISHQNRVLISQWYCGRYSIPSNVVVAVMIVVTEMVMVVMLVVTEMVVVERKYVNLLPQLMLVNWCVICFVLRCWCYYSQRQLWLSCIVLKILNRNRDRNGGGCDDNSPPNIWSLKEYRKARDKSAKTILNPKVISYK